MPGSGIWKTEQGYQSEVSLLLLLVPLPLQVLFDFTAIGSHFTSSPRKGLRRVLHPHSWQLQEKVPAVFGIVFGKWFASTSFPGEQKTGPRVAWMVFVSLARLALAVPWLCSSTFNHWPWDTKTWLSASVFIIQLYGAKTKASHWGGEGRGCQEERLCLS